MSPIFITFVLFLSLLVTFVSTSASDTDDGKYKLLSYHEIVAKFKEMSEKFPNLVRVEDANEKYGVPYQYGGCGDTDCVIHLVTVTDFESLNDEDDMRPQVYLSGNLHGDEQTGPLVLTYLVDYLTTHYSSSSEVQRLLKSRKILITPTTNAQGYYVKRRTEQADRNVFIDINRDFPYNRKDKDCFSSVASRVIFKIFQQNMIIGALTFHGGTEVIGYPWGSYNHIKSGRPRQGTEAPDHIMYTKIADILQQKSHVHQWNDLKVGDMTETVYPCYGAMEDWAYGVSWDTSKDAHVSECRPKTYLPFNKTEYSTNTSHIKPAIYLIETSFRKVPSESRLGDNTDIFCTNCTSDGHINRFIRMTTAFLDLVKVEPEITNLEIIEDRRQIMVEWKVDGCVVLDGMRILVERHNSTHFEDVDKLSGGTGKCNFEGEQTVFKHYINIVNTTNSEARFTFRISADQDFFTQNNPDPDVKPQTHLVNLRSLKEFTIDGKVTNRQKMYILVVKNGSVSLLDDGYAEISDDF